MSQRQGSEPTLGDWGEQGLLGRVFALLSEVDASERVLVGPGDDTALLAVGGARPAVLATTDTMVRGRDWRDDWSSAQDVGAKCVVQNLADLAAMGGVGTGLLVTLVAPASLPGRWALELTQGVARAAGSAGVPVIGGDLSSVDGDIVMVSITALGELPMGGPGVPVLRSGAQVGDVLAVSEGLGRSAAGLALLESGEHGGWPTREAAALAGELVGYHCRPQPDLTQGPLAAAAGATAMIDVSDGLGRDAGRIATASGVRIDLREEGVLSLVERLVPAVSPEVALQCVLTGGEEHSLLATFGAGHVPEGWTELGVVLASDTENDRVAWWRGVPLRHGGWDHFSP